MLQLEPWLLGGISHLTEDMRVNAGLLEPWARKFFIALLRGSCREVGCAEQMRGVILMSEPGPIQDGERSLWEEIGVGDC